MNKKLSIVWLNLLMWFIFPVKGQDFFSTEAAPDFFTFGARIGFNTSNRTFPSNHYNLWNRNSWGTGFNAGFLANLNFKDYLTIQPGIFYESRSGDYNYVSNEIGTEFGKLSQYGHWRGYYLTIPIMGIVKFNLADNIKWSVEFGPYFQFSLKQSGQNDLIALIDPSPYSSFYGFFVPSLHTFDFGFKMGTGLTFLQHYYVGVHYMAGVCNAWSSPQGGKNKSWMFSIGYEL